jgi:hypothetical protein
MSGIIVFSIRNTAKFGRFDSKKKGISYSEEGPIGSKRLKRNVSPQLMIGQIKREIKFFDSKKMKQNDRSGERKRRINWFD